MGDTVTARAPGTSGSSVPSGGTTGQVLKKNSNTDGDASWAADSTIPTGGSAGQALTKDSSTDADASWQYPPYMGPGVSFLGRHLVSISDRNPIGSDTDQLSNGTDTDANSRVAFNVIRGVQSVSVAFHNWNRPAFSTVSPNNITVTAAVEYSGKIQPLYFNGRRSVVIEPEAVVISDPTGLNVPSGATVFVRTRVVVASGEKWCNNAVIDSNINEGSEKGTGTSDKTLTGTIGPGPYGWAYGPLSVLSTPPRNGNAAVMGIGDSIMAGYNAGIGPGRAVNTYDWFFVRRGLRLTNPVFGVGISGETCQEFLNDTAWGSVTARAFMLRRFLVSQAKYCVVEYGVNDIYLAGRTLAQLKADIIALWKQFSDAGCYVYQCTLTPRSTSTDSWATTANQTVVSGDTSRVGFNDWVRDGAPVDNSTNLAAQAIGTVGALRASEAGHPLQGYLETADTVESARNSGKWKAPGPYTVDGIHPNVTGDTAMGTAITTSLFT